MATFTKLSVQEAAQMDATHKVNITFSDISTATNITFFTIPVGAKVSNLVLKNVTAWAGGTVSVATMSIGDGSSATQYLTTPDVFTGATAYVAAAASTNKIYAAASTLKATLALTGAGPTTGSLNLYFKLSNFADPAV